MFSSAPSSLLLSTAFSPADSGPGTTAPVAGGDAASGFAQVLKELTVQASGSLPVPGLPAETATVVTAEAMPAAAAGTLVTPADAAAPAAKLGKAATANGKVLPVVLPRAAETVAAPDAPAIDAAEDAPVSQTDDPAAKAVDPLLALAGLEFAAALPAGQAANPIPAEPDVAPAAVAALRAGAAPAAGHAAAPAALLSRLAAKPAPSTQADARPSPEPLSASAVPISVAARPEAAALGQAPSPVPERIEPAAIPPKAVRTIEPRRAEGPASGQSIPSASFLSAHQEAATPVQVGLAASPSAPASAPVDINAALDRLVAAREALSPVETALDVHHAEFGKVTIRFEQSIDGRLSAELRAADPELQRAVTAAVAADRGLSSGAESDGGRSTGTANPRGSTGEGEATPGERGQRGSERETNSRRTSGRPRTEPGSADPHAGVFA